MAIHSAENSRAVAVASRSEEKANSWARQFNVERGMGSYDEMINSQDIDAIYIPLPTALKAEWAVKAAVAGKHILVEKPLPGLRDVDELSSMVSTCEKHGVQFMDGTMWLHSIRTKMISEMLDRKDIGKVKRVIAAMTFRAPSEEWLHGGNGRTDKSREPMGCLGDQGWYPIGAILFAKRYVAPVAVRLDTWELNRVDTIVGATGTVFFEDGSTGVFDCGATSCHRSQFEIVGENGTIRVEDQVGGQGRSGYFEAYEKEYTGSTYFKMDDKMGKETVIDVEGCDHTKLMIQDFSDCIQRKEIDSSWPSKSLLAQKVLVALFKSYENGGEKIVLSD
uniref:Oxidoreductase n=1 Tax=Palpitomonas bilix TaxID=652834 RepID=A0A7S3GGH1_9EUKA